jgi:hypothetical protein
MWFFCNHAAKKWRVAAIFARLRNSALNPRRIDVACLAVGFELARPLSDYRWRQKCRSS